jgi:hypothetical protein
MPGGEYLQRDVLIALWQAMERALEIEFSESNLPPRFLESARLDPKARALDRGSLLPRNAASNSCSIVSSTRHLIRILRASISISVPYDSAGSVDFSGIKTSLDGSSHSEPFQVTTPTFVTPAINLPTCLPS